MRSGSIAIHLISLFLIPPKTHSAAETEAAAVLVKKLLPVMIADGGIEHVSALAGPEGLQIGLFCNRADPESVRRDVRQGCERMIDQTATFAGWQIGED